MIHFLSTNVGRLRLISFLEGMSLLLLVFVAMPAKYIFHEPFLTAIVGAIHGGLFVAFVLITLQVSISEKMSFSKTTWKILVSCLIPFATFYVDAKILKPMQEAENKKQ